MNRTAKLATFALGVTLAAPVFAANPSAVQDLQSARQQVAQAADRTKGSHKQSLLMEGQRIDGLIGDLQAGKAVDPAAIDRALNTAEHGPR